MSKSSNMDDAQARAEAEFRKAKQAETESDARVAEGKAVAKALTRRRPA